MIDPTLRRSLRLLSASLLTVALAACGGSGEEGDAATEDTAHAPEAAAPAPAPAPGGTTLTDAQIAMVAMMANTADSAGGVMAQQKGTKQEVKDFGKTMETDHGAVNKQATALAQKLGVTPEESDMSRELKQSHDQATQMLQGQTGAAFDRAYIDHEVQMHQTVLDALNNTLIPQAKNPELKALLEQVRPAVQAHLDRAKQIQGTLGATAAR